MECVHCRTPIPENSRFCLACGADVSTPGGGPLPPVTPDLATPLAAAVQGRYRVERLLGRGGMAAVYLAQDLALDRPVAIKVLPPEVAHDRNLVLRFEHEARTAARLDHPNIIPIFAVASTNGLHYFVMKYVDGRSLEELTAHGLLPVELCQRILWEAAIALGHAHRRGVVHRDVKPANIMLDDESRVIVTDFGISKALQSSPAFTGTGQIVGTPYYMSPEQTRGQALDGRSDQYSLAVVGYRMLAGRLPFSDDSIHTVIYKHIFQEPRSVAAFRPDAPAPVVASIMRGMRKRPRDRFPSMDDFAAAVWPEQPVVRPSGSVARASSGVVVLADTEAPTELTGPTGREPAPATRRSARRRSTWPVAAGILLVAAAGGAWLAVGGPTLLAGGAANRPPPVHAPQAPESTADTVSGAAGPSGDAAGTVSTAGAANQEPAASPAEGPPGAGAAARVPAVGYLTVDVVDAYGEVSVDDVYVRDTPLVKHRLRPGRHTVRITREGCAPVTEIVVVTAGNEIRLKKSLVCESFP